MFGHDQIVGTVGLHPVQHARTHQHALPAHGELFLDGVREFHARRGGGGEQGGSDQAEKTLECVRGLSVKCISEERAGLLMIGEVRASVQMFAGLNYFRRKGTYLPD